MKNKTIAVLLILTVLNIGLILTASASQPYEQARGGFSTQLELLKGKPSKPDQGGIATGVVSELTGNRRYAIIIGISDYDGSANDLQYCDEDAVEFRDVLITYGWRESQITMLIDSEATRPNIFNAINSVSRSAKSDDAVVFFYSGHGSVSNQDVDGDEEKKDECIIPWECTYASFIWDGELAKAFAGCVSQRMMFFFDSCYSGGMTDLAGEGRLILMACGENQLSIESSVWQNGQFTYYFVDRGMAAKLADANSDNRVTFEEAFDFAKANCQRQSPVASDRFANDMLP